MTDILSISPPTSGRRIGLALIGLGPGSQPHVKSLVDLVDRVDVRHAVCRRPDQADLGPLAGRVRATADLDAVLADPAVHAVIVATPAAKHLDIAGRCLAAGRHVLVEKPLEVSLPRAQALVAAARASGRRFGVVLQHRFRPGSQRLRALLAEGALGAVQFASVRVPWWRPQAGYYDQPGRGTLARDGGGVLLTQAIHALDLFRSLVGVTTVEAAQAATTAVHHMETEDYAAALLRLDGGAPGLLMATTAMFPGSPEVIEIAGTRATATLAAGRLQVRWHDGREETVEAEGPGGSGANIMDFPHDAHRALIADFLDAIESDRDPQVTGEEALATQRLIDEVLARAGWGGHVHQAIAT
jgi:predicted dehydrogenase